MLSDDEDDPPPKLELFEDLEATDEAQLMRLYDDELVPLPKVGNFLRTKGAAIRRAMTMDSESSKLLCNTKLKQLNLNFDGSGKFVLSNEFDQHQNLHKN